MRIPLLFGLLLSSATLCCSQTPANDLAKLWNQHDAQGIMTNQLPASWHVDLHMPLQMPALTLPPRPAAPTANLWSPSIDPSSIVHPKEQLSAATPLMQDPYPGLTWMPVEQPEGKTEARLETIPTQWPGLKIDAIPQTWSDFKLQEMQGESPSLSKPAQ